MERTQSQPATAEKVLRRIEEENIKPIPVWRFSARDKLFWSSAVISISVGSIAIAAAIFVVVNAGWRYYAATHDSFFTFFIESLPYLWLITALLFLLIAYENVRQTNRGYRFEIAPIIIFSLTASATGGVLLYLTGIGHTFDHYIAINLPFHDSVVEDQQQRWEDGQQGLLAGSISGISEDATWFTLKTFSGNEWKVYTEELSSDDFEAIASFSDVRVVGAFSEELPAHEIIGCLVFPWRIYGGSSENNSPMAYPVSLNINCTQPGCERNENEERITKCKDVRPYESLKLIQR